MGQIDKLQRQILNVNENFVDAISKETRKYGIEIKADDLEDVYPSNVVVDKDGNAHEVVGDVRKFWKSKGTILALLGIESQTSVDKKMPPRVMQYDSSKYLEQLKKNPGECRPVITFVLNFSKKPWDGPRSLRECVTFAEGTEETLLPLFNDFTIHVINMCELTLEEIEQMPSDLRFYATFHYNLRRPDVRVTYPSVRDPELARVYVKTLTNDQIDIPIEILEEGGFQMNELYQEYAAYLTKQLIDRKTKEAREEALEEARIKTQKSAKRMSEKGYSIEVIADLLGETEETIEALLTQE